MIPRLADDPAWARYEWELRHLALMAFRQGCREVAVQIAVAVMPAMRKFSEALEEWAAAAARLEKALA